MTKTNGLEKMLQDGWKIVSTFGYTSLVLAKGKSRRLIDKTGKCTMKEYEEKKGFNYAAQSCWNEGLHPLVNGERDE